MMPAPGRGVSPMLPLSYLVTATAAFVLATLAVPWLASELAGHYYQPRVLALTHTVTLGWITLTIMGASYQIVPIVLGRPVWSERMARWQLALTTVGIVCLVARFFIGEWSGLVWAAALVTLGVGLHLVNTVLSVRGLAAWTFTAWLVTIAHAGLALTALSGTPSTRPQSCTRPSHPAGSGSRRSGRPRGSPRRAGSSPWSASWRSSTRSPGGGATSRRAGA